MGSCSLGDAVSDADCGGQRHLLLSAKTRMGMGWVPSTGRELGLARMCICCSAAHGRLHPERALTDWESWLTAYRS